MSLKQSIRKLFFPNPIRKARRLGVRIGENCRLVGKCTFGSEPYLISIGNHVSITNSTFVTHDGGVWVFRDEHPEIDVVAPIHIGNNVFIGSRSTILPGVTIGNNVVVGAGSIVSKSLPDNCVAAGIPAKVISDIDSYQQKVMKKAESTKSLDKGQKKLFYINKFHNRSSKN